MRVVLTFAVLIGGIALALVSYLFFAAPIGVADNESFSNPRVPFASALFVLGLMLVFTSALVYELLPSRRKS